MNNRADIAPILIIAFNRPHLVAGLIGILRRVRPEQVFFAVDAPRENHPTDSSRCKSVRDMVEMFDWGCRVETRFAEKNQGCQYGPANAISWFLDHVEAGIVLEDDCHPVFSFFPYATELLVRYADHPEIGMISGNNYYRFQSDKTQSYFFSRLPLIYGWATWRRAWSCFDVTLNAYCDRLDDIRGKLGHSESFRKYWWKYVEMLDQGLNTWDVQWAIALFANELLCIKPAVNLVCNKGFCEDSTHTSFEYDSPRFEAVEELPLPLHHPIDEEAMCFADEFADIKEERRYVSIWRRGWTWVGAHGGVLGKRSARLVSRVESCLR